MTKCIRVASSATTKEVVDVLVEKFRPDMRMLTANKYNLFELHVNGGKDMGPWYNSLLLFLFRNNLQSLTCYLEMYRNLVIFISTLKRHVEIGCASGISLTFAPGTANW